VEASSSWRLCAPQPGHSGLRHATRRCRYPRADSKQVAFGRTSRLQMALLDERAIDTLLRAVIQAMPSVSRSSRWPCWRSSAVAHHHQLLDAEVLAHALPTSGMKVWLSLTLPSYTETATGSRADR